MVDQFVLDLLEDHRRHPRNYGEMSKPDFSSQQMNPRCIGPTHPEGDEVAVLVSVSSDEPGLVEEIRFTGRGCTLSQAAASLLIDRMIGRDITDIIEWDGETIEDVVGMSLTPSRLQCAELALVAFREAVRE